MTLTLAAAEPRIEHIMGTAIVIDVRDGEAVPGSIARATRAAFEHFRLVDERFSTYREDSEVSRLNRGELAAQETSAELREVLAMCEQARIASDGYFDIRAHRRDGQLDPSGLVKGWSVEGAARTSCTPPGRPISPSTPPVTWSSAGEPEKGAPWRIGIRNPWDAQTVVAVIETRNLAIATSATYERGEHIVDPHSGRVANGVASMTVVGPSLTWADTWATAAFAMGVRGVDWVARELDGYEALAVTLDRRLVMTAGFERLRA